MLLTGQHHYPIPVDVKQCMWSLLASQMNRVASPVVHALHGSIFLILVPWIHYYLACKIVSTFGLWTGNLLDWTANGVVQGCTSIHQTVTPRSQLSTNVYFYSPDVFYSSPNVPTVTLKGFSSFFFLTIHVFLIFSGKISGFVHLHPNANDRDRDYYTMDVHVYKSINRDRHLMPAC